MLETWRVFPALAFLATSFVLIHSLKADESKNQIIRSAAENTTDYFLPTDVIPSEYFIHLTPFIVVNNFTFNGVVKIIADVKRTTSKIVLHVNQLDMHDVAVLKINNNGNAATNLKVKEITKTDKYQFMNIIMASPIGVGSKIRIEISYTGILNYDQAGLFRRSYKVENEIRWLVGSHMAATQARKAFPCFDEPAMKAVFYISIVAPKNYSAISNMPIKWVKNGITEFEKTPMMSTYLVALIISDFRSLEKREGGHYYRISSNPELTPYMTYALSVMSRAVDFFETRLAVPYTLPKLDAIAIPEYFGGMENWGAVVYRENFVVYDPKVTSLLDKKTIRNSVTHEISHLWFGDPITPKRWDFLWLSEALATYFESHAYEDAIASWNLGSQFVVDAMQPSFAADASSSSEPMTRHVYSPDEIQAIFDTIVYSKGASIVRMLEKLLGQKMFYAALHKYLRSNQSIATPETLNIAFEDEIKANNYRFNESFTRFLNNWTSQAGFPVVHAHFTKDTVKLSQNRFLLKPSTSDSDESTWIVPISWATRSNPNFDDTRKVVWLRKKEESIKIESANSDWVIINVQQTAYYRVNYDENMWKRIINVLKSKDYVAIHEINRASLMDDLLNFGRVGLVNYDTVLSATQYLAQEKNYIPWKAAFEGFTYMKNRFSENSEIYKFFRAHILSLLQQNYQKLGFYDIAGEKELDAQLRMLVLQWLCSLDHEDCISKSLDVFKKVQRYNSYIVPANQQSIVYCTAIKHGSASEWNYLWEKLIKSNNPIEQTNIFAALACSKNSTDLERLLLNSITPDSGIKKFDAEVVFSYVVGASSTGALTIMKFIKNNYNRILNYLGDVSVITSTVSSISDHLPTRNLVQKFKGLIEKNNKTLSSISDTLQDTLNNSVYELDWYDRNSPKILQWLKKNYPNLK